MTRAHVLAVLVAGLSGCASCDEPRAPAPARPLPPEDPARASATSTQPAAEPPAERPPLPTPPPSEAATRRALLAEGRRLERAGDHAAAIERYERALEIAPGDATLLGELGWALFRAGRLDEAFEATRNALERAETDRQEGAMLYNLGRIAEALERTGAALELYRRSLAVRPNEVVRARILALGGQAPAPGEVPVEAWVSSSVVGAEPVASLEAVCDALAPGWSSTSEEYEDARACDPELLHRATGERGILEAGIVRVGGESDEDWLYHLVARTARGWFVVREAGANWYGPSSMNGGEASQTVEIRDVIPGGPLELVATVTTHETWAEWCAGGSMSTETLLICGAVADRIGCYLEARTSSSSSSGTWRDGDGWAGSDEEYAREVCGEEEDGSDGEIAAAGLAELVDREETVETIDVEIDEAGRVTFTGAEGDRERVPPAALARPIPLARVPCLGPRPDPLFGCGP